MSKKLEWMPLHIHRLKASSAWDLPDYLFGQYIRLLVEAADSERPGYLPAAFARLKKLARAECSASQFESRNWRALARYFKSTEDGHWIYNERLLEILTEQAGKMKKSKKPPGASLSLSAIPDWVPKEPWEAFVESRKKLRRPMTEHAADLIIRELEKLKAQGHDPGEVLNQSIRRGWLDVFPLESYRRGEIQVKSRPSDAWMVGKPGDGGSRPWEGLSEEERMELVRGTLHHKWPIPDFMEPYAERVRAEKQEATA